MMSIPVMRRTACALLGLMFAWSSGHAAGERQVPLALKNVPPERLSSGVYQALYGEPETAAAADSVATGVDPRLAADAFSSSIRQVTLDPRVGHNWVLQTAPPELPEDRRQHAEPHLARGGGVTLGVFQTGRAADGGAAAIGYSLSRDGGWSWGRGLFPNLTQATGGTYVRATDPVAVVDNEGTCYLNALAARTLPFENGVIAILRSSSIGGSAETPSVSWSAPIIAYTSPSSTVFPDKNWMAINNYSGSSTYRRLAITYTSFTSDSQGNTTGAYARVLLSDDRGNTWTAPIDITAPNSQVQGTQPLFLANGSLLCVYYNFVPGGLIQVKRSNDGGRTWPAAATTITSGFTLYTDPVLRIGNFLPSATVARDAGTVHVAYTATHQGAPRILVTSSANNGDTWSTPVPVNDTPSSRGVFNPAIAASADGRTLVVTFYDKRHGASDPYWADLYAALSFDGGSTWEPNVRLSSRSSDVRLAQNTSRGYMLGDYLGLVPGDTAEHPFTAIWCDTRLGRSDAFAAQLMPTRAPGYSEWKTVNFSPARRAQGSVENADDDLDGLLTWQEYAFGTDPRQMDGPSVLDVVRTDTTTKVSYPIRAAVDLVGNFAWSANGSTWTPYPPNPVSVSEVEGNPLLRIYSANFTHNPGEARYFRPDVRLEGQERTSETMPVRTVINTDTRLINLSSRGFVGTGARQLIAGFVVTGGSKSLLVRGTGPGLSSLGVSGPLPDPQLALYAPGAGTPDATNNNWTDNAEMRATFQRLGAFAFSSELEAALIVPVSSSYTALLSDTTSRTGIGLIEVYDADATPGASSGAQLLNLSSRGYVGAGEQSLIAGLVIRGSQPRRVLIRAVGPTLATLGVSDVLADPVLHIYGGARSASFAANDDWSRNANPVALSTAMTAAGAFPLPENSRDAAMVLTLDPGAYTAVVSGANGATGIALVEVYDLR